MMSSRLAFTSESDLTHQIIHGCTKVANHSKVSPQRFWYRTGSSLTSPSSGEIGERENPEEMG